MTIRFHFRNAQPLLSTVDRREGWTGEPHGYWQRGMNTRRLQSQGKNGLRQTGMRNCIRFAFCNKTKYSNGTTWRSGVIG